jgi:peptidoglycan hydrolase-like protein with peptidoglycan-binding domain
MLKKILAAMAVSLCMAAGLYAQGTDKPAGTAAAETKTGDTKKAPIFRPTKDQIKQVQGILKGKKLYNAEPSGKYDDDTRAGIKEFQKGNGLKETGTLNRATLEKFGVELTDSQKKIPVSPNSYASGGGSSTKKSSATTASAGDAPKKAAPFRANKDQIMAAQKLLKQGSMYSGDETGKLDDPTREGLKKYQEAKGMKVTGTLNAVTLEKMGIALTDKQKANEALRH